MSFNTLGLSAELLRAVSEKGYSEATPIQLKAIPIILEGRDILAGAQTGTGKTAGFTLPLLQRLSTPAPAQENGRRPIRALILTPTRELAAQVEESVRTYGKHLPLRSTVIFGGVSINPQIDTLRRGVDILVATPGRLLDHVGQKTVDLSHVEILVLDEADRMLDMGFIRDIRKVLALLPRGRQNLLFSATFSDEIKELSDGLLNSPALIEVARRNTAAELVTQVVHPVDRERKRELLSFLVGSNNWKQVLVFTRTKHGANRLAEQLERDGLTAAAIHGNKSQGARTRALAEFKNGTVRVLVATDIAARGLDIDQLPHVVNYELPNVPEDYVHRIGRTGRAGNEGEALSLVCVDELDLLKDIERLLKREIPKVVMAGYEPDMSVRPEPIRKTRGARTEPRSDGQRQGAPRQGAPRQGAARDGASRQGAARNSGRRPQGDARPAGDRSSGGRSASPRQTNTPVSAMEANGNTLRPEVDGNRRTDHDSSPPQSPGHSRPAAGGRGGPGGSRPGASASGRPHAGNGRRPGGDNAGNNRGRGDQGRPAHARPAQSRPGSSQGKPRPQRSHNEVPALLGGSKRDE